MLNVSARIIPSPMNSPSTEQKDFVPKEAEPAPNVTTDNHQILPDNHQQQQISVEAASTTKIPENAVIDELTDHNIDKKEPQNETPVLSRIVEDYALEMSQKNESTLVSF